jgi:uncharacterized RDD family membrane protein YckC
LDIPDSVLKVSSLDPPLQILLDMATGWGIVFSIMAEEPIPPAQPVIPTPHLPQTPIPSSEDGREPVKPSDPGLATPGEAAVKVRILNAENTADGEPLAGGLAPFNARVLAVLIDVVVMIGLQISVSFFLPGFASRIAWLVGLAYLVTRDSLAFLGGQSIGKKVMKLKVVTVDGKSLVNNWEPALIRNGVLAIPFFAVVELIVLLIREDKPERGRRLGDEWGKTKVITAPDEPAA